jgi:hypothetical protein
MRILYIIGNGLDVALGLKTRYPDFYDYYCSLEESERNEDIIKLRKEITKNKEDWKDLECQLGKYTEKVSNSEEMEKICLNLNDSLREYLLKEQAKVSSEDFNRKICIDRLLHPEDFLLNDDKDVFYNIPNTSTRYIDIITLNYTDTLEKVLFNGRNGIVDSGFDFANRRWEIGTIYHVHGTLSGSPLVGVDNIIQIANKEFAENEDIREIMIKPEANSAIKSGVDRRCRDLIERAEVIILFGVSIGETDLTWWKAIGKRLKSSGATVIIFHHDPQMNLVHHEYLIARNEREVRADFVSKSECGGSEKEWRKRILVTFNPTFMDGVRKTDNSSLDSSQLGS